MQDLQSINLVEQIDLLIKKITQKYCIIAPIARKGIRVLELSNLSNDLFDEGRILYFDSIKYHAEDLAGKMIVLFDESSRTGNSIFNSKKELENFSKMNNLNLKIKTS